MGSKARESTKAMALAFCIAGFSACGCQNKSVVYETECRHVAVQKGKQNQNHSYSTETYTSDFIFNSDVLKWVASAVFPGEVLSAGGGVPKEGVLQQSFEFSGEVG